MAIAVKFGKLCTGTLLAISLLMASPLVITTNVSAADAPAAAVAVVVD